MEKDLLSRKLAVILHADVVGSTALVQKDEALAHERIKNTFNYFSRTISSYGGMTRELRGDALVAEFPRASDAVSAALAFQQSNHDLNSTIDDEIRPCLRIGISLGEVIISDNTITGAGVVLAQRLEQIAEPGGVVVQGTVSETVPGRMPFDFRHLGKLELKGFDYPVRTCAVSMQKGEAIPEPEGYRVPRESKSLPSYLRDKPSIAVLPFSNMSNDVDYEFFADGIADEIITALSRFHDLLVIARNSSFTYRETSVDVREIGSNLNVLFILEGSVRVAGKRLRITAQLIEASTGNHIWAERFDRLLEDIFKVQDEITILVAATVGQQVRAAEIKSAFLREPQDLRARDLVARSRWHTDKMTEEDFAKARELCATALELNPDFVGAHSQLAFISIMELVHEWGDSPSRDLAAEALQSALTGIRIDPDDEAARTYLAMVKWLTGEHDEAIKECETVIRINPNYAYAVGTLGLVYAFSGINAYQLAVKYLDQVIRLSPNDPWLQYYLCHRGTTELLAGHLDAATEWFQKSIQRNPDYSTPYRYLTSAWALAGDFKKARHALKEVERLIPGYSIARATRRTRKVFRNDEDFNLIIESLRIAGVPE